MLTREQCKKLGLRYIDLASEKNKIEFFASQLTEKMDLIAESLPVISAPPEGASFEGASGRIAVDNEYLYICTETNIWRRVKLNEL